MLAKFRFNTLVDYRTPHDFVCALFETQGSSVANVLAGMLPANAAKVDVANSYINTSKNAIGWSVVNTSGTGATRSIIIQAPCKNSAKVKSVLLSTSTNLGTLQAGNGRSGNSLIDPIADSNYYSVSIIPLATAVIDVYVSVSSRHLLIQSVRLDTMAYVSAGVFEFVTNDGYYTETSPYVPVVQAHSLDTVSTGFVSNARALRVPRYKNMRVAGYPDVTAQQCYWETPYSEDEFLPADNGGYDYLGANTDRTPLLVPFGVCNKTTHAFIGGAISDLCDVYLGPTNVGGNYEETLIGADTYVSLQMAATQKRLFVPKG